MARERSGREAGLLAEKIARDERLQAVPQPLFDFGIDRRLAARSARPVGTAELRVQPGALSLYEPNDLGKDGCGTQRRRIPGRNGRLAAGVACGRSSR